MIRSLAILVIGTAAAWIIAVFPAVSWWGESAFLFSATGAGLCLLPAVVTLMWTKRAFKSSPEQQLLAVLGGTAFRMVFVIAGAMVLFFSVPDFQYIRFWLWVVGFYLVVLGLEVFVVTRQDRASVT